MFVKLVEDLKIFQDALQLAKEIDELVKRIPHYWNIPECNQILRSSGSAPSNIQEGFAHRFYVMQFIRYLYIAMGSSDECQGHLKKLINNGYLEREIAKDYIQRYKFLAIKILNFINYLKNKSKVKIK